MALIYNCLNRVMRNFLFNYLAQLQEENIIMSITQRPKTITKGKYYKGNYMTYAMKSQ